MHKLNKTISIQHQKTLSLTDNSKEITDNLASISAHATAKEGFYIELDF